MGDAIWEVRERSKTIHSKTKEDIMGGPVSGFTIDFVDGGLQQSRSTVSS